MQEIDTLIDENPNLAAELVELDIRNAQAHRELASYNETKKFIGEHPITQNFLIAKRNQEELKILRTQSPIKLMNEITNLQQNIRRVESNINTKKYKSNDEHRAWLENLQRLKIKQEVLAKLISE
ncbi:MAG: hypothetical protein LBS50_10255 [Prevotellaceae bacterium]|jgi:vacuolar-type H+-ATPase subunit I/STV1|nr:hypothetical protein [Prevotellaceae bacterium]